MKITPSANLRNIMRFTFFPFVFCFPGFVSNVKIQLENNFKLLTVLILEFSTGSISGYGKLWTEMRNLHLNQITLLKNWKSFSGSPADGILIVVSSTAFLVRKTVLDAVLSVRCSFLLLSPKPIIFSGKRSLMQFLRFLPFLCFSACPLF